MGGGEGSRAVANLPRPYLIRLHNDAVLGEQGHTRSPATEYAGAQPSLQRDRHPQIHRDIVRDHPDEHEGWSPDDQKSGQAAAKAHAVWRSRVPHSVSDPATTLVREHPQRSATLPRVRWVGHDDESWEPAKALPERMIAAFELQYAADHGHASIPRLVPRPAPSSSSVDHRPTLQLLPTAQLGEGRRELELLEPSPSPKSPSPKPPPSTEPEPSPSPLPELSRSPEEPSPSPEPELSPSPSPEVSPSPSPESPSPNLPSPEPEPTPSPSPELSPSTLPEASPSPSPEVSASPKVSPSPSPDPPHPPEELSPSPSPELPPTPLPEHERGSDEHERGSATSCALLLRPWRGSLASDCEQATSCATYGCCSCSYRSARSSFSSASASLGAGRRTGMGEASS